MDDSDIQTVVYEFVKQLLGAVFTLDEDKDRRVKAFYDELTHG